MSKASKSRGGAAKKTQSKKLQTSTEHIMALRSALYDETGSDRNVLENLKAFCQIDRNGIKATLTFHTKMPRRMLDQAVALSKENMSAVYEASGYDWSEDDVRAELRVRDEADKRMHQVFHRTVRCSQEQSNRFVVARAVPDDPEGPLGKVLGYLQFRFSFQGEFLNEMSGKPSLFVWDLQVLPEVQRHGLGKHLLTVAELVARQQKMYFLQVLCPEEAEAGIEFLTEKLSGFEEDTMEYSPNATEDDFYVIYQKTLPEPVAPTAPAADVSKVASTTAVKPKAPLSEDNSN